MAIEAVKLATIVVMYQWESLIQKTYLLFIPVSYTHLRAHET